MRWAVWVIAAALLASACVCAAAGDQEKEQPDAASLLAKKRHLLIDFLSEVSEKLTDQQRLMVFEIPELPKYSKRSIEDGLKLMAKFPGKVTAALERAADAANQWRVLHNAVKSDRADMDFEWKEFTAEVQKMFIEAYKTRSYALEMKRTVDAVNRVLNQPLSPYNELVDAIDELVFATWDELRWYAPVYDRLRAHGGIAKETASQPILQCSGCDKAFNRGHLVRRIKPEVQKEGLRAAATLVRNDAYDMQYEVAWSGFSAQPEETWAEWANRVDFPRPRHCDAACVWEDYSGPDEAPKDEL